MATMRTNMTIGASEFERLEQYKNKYGLNSLSAAIAHAIDRAEQSGTHKKGVV